MSNGLHHVAPASFFPTAKELSSGLQWFKDHPILAAAAATAVSVITYLHTADDSEINDTSVDGDFDKAAVAATTDDVALDGHERSPRAVRRSSAPAVTTSPSSTTILAAAATTTTATPTPSHHPPTRRASAPLGRVTPPALRKPGSEGKLSSPAAVSWVDEHGGSLTQVFEHLTTVDDPHDRHELRSGTHSDLHGTTPEDDDAEDDEDDGYPDLDRPLRQGGSSPRLYGRPPTPRRNAHTRPGEDDMPESSSSPASSAHWMGKLAHGAMQSPQLVGAAHDRQTPSPQWGWYVPITPPQDASAGPPSSSTSSASLQLHGDSSDRAESSMRRSTSGRIKT